MTAYDPAYYSLISPGSIKSAEIIVPLVVDLLNPQSVVDIGCGRGCWLAVFKSHHIADILGVDGLWIKDEMLLIPKSCFLAHDLTRRLDIGRRFDLAISLEVAEHLDSNYARGFVDNLVKLSSLVLFSAAIPYQGSPHHVNEQWPSYWAALFDEHGYVPIDCIRPAVWNNEQVDWWYAQNVLLFAEKEQLLGNSRLHRAFELTRVSQLCLVHPQKYLNLATRTPAPLGVKQVLRMFPSLLLNAMKRRLKKPK